MKLIEGMVITDLGESVILVPTGEAAEKYHGIIRLNETGADIVQGLIDGLSEEQIAKKLVTEYEDVDLPRARQAVRDVVAQFLAAGLLEE